MMSPILSTLWGIDRMRHQCSRRIRKAFLVCRTHSAVASSVQDPYRYQEHYHNRCEEEGHINAVDESSYQIILEQRQFGSLRRSDYSCIMGEHVEEPLRYRPGHQFRHPVQDAVVDDRCEHGRPIVDLMFLIMFTPMSSSRSHPPPRCSALPSG